MVHYWTPSADAPSSAKNKLWDPLKVLGIINTDPGYGSITCIGYAPSQGRRCRNPIRKDNRECIMNTLDNMACIHPGSPTVASRLRDIVEPALCWRHKGDAGVVLQRWKQDLQKVTPRSKFGATGPTTTKKTPAQRDYASKKDERDQIREITKKLKEMQERLVEMEERMHREERQRKKREKEERQRQEEEEDEEEDDEDEDDDEDDDEEDDEDDDEEDDEEDEDEDEEEEEAERQRKNLEEEQERQRREKEEDKERRRKERQRKEREEEERLEKERLDKERLEKERLEKERLEKEKSDRAANNERIRQNSEKVRQERERQKRADAAREREEWATAWQTYQTQWTTFKASQSSSSSSSMPIPWPVKSGLHADVKSSTVQEFFQRAVPADANWKKTIHAECLKWHPDKIHILISGREPTAAETMVVDVVSRVLIDSLETGRT